MAISSLAQRRTARRGAYQNGALWGVGNGLTSTALVTYLAQSLGARGAIVGLIIASPQLVGVLRIASPALVRWNGNRRRACLGWFRASALLLLALPILSAPGVLPSTSASLAALVALWASYHLLEYLAVVAMWSWFGDLVPARVRGRFIGVRERYLMMGRIAGMLLVFAIEQAWLLTKWLEIDPLAGILGDPRWAVYAAPAMLGALLMLLALVPLARLPDVGAIPANERSPPRIDWRRLFAPLRDRQFWPLLLFGTVFPLANGLTQAAQARLPYAIGISLSLLLAIRTTMSVGQSLAAAPLGRAIDRYGARNVMFASQLFVAAGLSFYCLASPERPAWLWGAWIMWIAYAGLNIGLPHTLLRLAPPAESSSYVAVYFAWSGLVYGLASIAGGLLLQALESDSGRALLAEWNCFDAFLPIFIGGIILRAIAALFLLPLKETREVERHATSQPEA